MHKLSCYEVGDLLIYPTPFVTQDDRWPKEVRLGSAAVSHALVRSGAIL